MAIFNDHPYTSITVKIDQLAKPPNANADDTLELYVSDLLHLIKIQASSGATEAARAIRKRIKYGDTPKEQVRAMDILELLVLNAGSKIGPVVASDSKLLDLLKGIIAGSGKTGTGLPYDAKVQTRARQLAVGWKSELADLEGYKYLASLWKSIPKTHTRSRSRASTEPENAFEDARGIRSPSPSSPAMGGARVSRAPPRPMSPKPELDSKPKLKKFGSKLKKSKRKKRTVLADKQYGISQINYAVEAPNIRNTLAESQTHSAALSNLLILLAPGTSPLDDAKVQTEFEKCKSVRRKVLKYLQYVGAGDPSQKRADIVALDEEFLGGLIAANEQLVEVFKKYDFMAGYTEENPREYDDESTESYYTELDSEVDLVAEELASHRIGEPGSSSKVKSPPPRPSKPADLVAPKPLERIETNGTNASGDPFGDGNEVEAAKSVYY